MRGSNSWKWYTLTMLTKEFFIDVRGRVTIVSPPAWPKNVMLPWNLASTSSSIDRRKERVAYVRNRSAGMQNRHVVLLWFRSCWVNAGAYGRTYLILGRTDVVRCISTGVLIYRCVFDFFATGILTYTYVHTDVVRLLLYRMYHTYVHNKLYCGSLR